MDPKNATVPDYESRFERQDRFAPLGKEGGQRLRNASVLVCGCGALGTSIAERLGRAGVGRLRIVDRDWVEWNNLPRQTLFEERDAIDQRPKAVACADALKRIDSRLQVEPIVADLTCDNVVALADGCDVILDGTDNFETRFLINDYCVSNHVPWVHGGCVGAGGQVMTILPGQTACYRCLIQDVPSRESIQTCDAVGVLGPAVGIIASWQAAEAIKILSGHREAVCQDLLVFDAWDTSCRKISLAALKRANRCPTCYQRQFPFLEGSLRTESTVLCGKNAVQLMTPTPVGDLENLKPKIEHLGSVQWNGFFLKLKASEYTITIFKDGRVVVEGTTHVNEAKNLLAKTIGG